MVYNTAGVFLGTALANILTDLQKSGKNNIVVIPTADISLIQKFTPISKFAGVLTVDAATNFFTEYLLPSNTSSPSLFRIQIALNVAGIFSAVYKIGSETFVYTFNSGAALVASALYIFDILLHPNDQINLRSSIAGVANIRIQEITLATQ